MKRLIIFALMVSALSFLVSGAFSDTPAQGFERWKLSDRKSVPTAPGASGGAGSSGTEITPKDTASAGYNNKYLLDAGQNLQAAAGLRYAGFGFALAGTALSRYGDESDMELSRGLQYGSAIILISPYYVGEAGRQLVRADPGSQLQEAGRALQRYRSSYYGGLAVAVLGTGLMALQISKESGTDEPGFIAGAMLALGGLLYTTFAPPYYLGSAGSKLGRVETPSVSSNLQMQKAGSHLTNASGYQYGSIVAYLLGGVVTAYSVSEKDDSGIVMGVGILGLGALSDLLAAVKISYAGISLDKASKMQLSD